MHSERAGVKRECVRRGNTKKRRTSSARKNSLPRGRVGRHDEIDELDEALAETRHETRTTVIVIEVDKAEGVPDYESWWDVPVAEVSEMESVRKVRREYDRAIKDERIFL